MKTSSASNRWALLAAFYAFLIGIAALWAAPRNARAQLYVTNRPGGGAGVVSEYDAQTGDLINANFITGLHNPLALALREDTLFVSNQATGTIGKYDAKTGAAINPGFIIGLKSPGDLDWSGFDLFVTTSSGVGKYDVTTGAAINPRFITGLGGRAGGILVDGTSLLVAIESGTTVGEYDSRTGATINSSFITGLDSPLGLAIRGNRILVVNSGSTVGAYSQYDGRTINANFIKGLHQPYALAVLGNKLFVTNSDNGTVGEYDADTGAPINRSFIRGLSLPFGIAVRPAPLPPQFLYVANLESKRSGHVSGYAIDPKTGALAPVPGSPFEDDSGGPVSVAVDSISSVVYAANFDRFNVAIYHFDEQTGALARVSSAATDSGPASVAVVQFYVYVANELSNNISGFGPEPATPVPGSPFHSGRSPISIAVGGQGRWVYVANFEDNDVSAFSIDDVNGKLMLLLRGGFPTGGKGPVSVAADPDGEFLYVANEGSSDLAGYSITLDGYLQGVPGTPFATGRQPLSVAVDPTSHFVYVANGADNTVSGYYMNHSTGALKPIPGSPFHGHYNNPVSLAVDSTAKFLYVASFGDNTVSGYKLEKDGSLKADPISTVTTPQPHSLAITRR
jgi:6-phosphogluconolactonase (cycloisomerase 2 family)